MKINKFTVVGMLNMAFVFGSLVADYGELQPAYSVNYTHFIWAVLLFGGLFLCGYLGGKSDS